MAGSLLGLLLLLAAGCAHRGPAGPGPLLFPRDTLAITNETHWVYEIDPVAGTQRSVRRDPPPTYALRCFVLARTVKQFHLHATFDPNGPAPDADEARRLVRKVVSRSPRTASEPEERIRIPGHPGLHGFSAAWPRVFQEECGGAWHSYVQRGHWRMILPFGREGQRREAEALAQGVREGRAPVVHLVDFPRLRMNHAVVFMDVSESDGDFRFTAYDPNSPDQPVTLRFEGRNGRFEMQPVAYFLGGPVSAYEVYCRGFR